MIHKHYQDGDKLDVAGLNEITVLIDRSETELTEVGHNCWTPRQDGPPHVHNDKEQIFFVTSGKGIIKLGDKKYKAEPGNIAYVPAGLVHQSITTGDERLCYMLYNTFINPDKEGHASFRDHIEKVKQERKQQAETGNYNIEQTGTLSTIKEPKFIDDIYSGKRINKEMHYEINLLSKDETGKSELTYYAWSAGSESSDLIHEKKEQTIFILKGKGVVTIDNNAVEINSGEVIFIPLNTSYSIKTMDEELSYISLFAVLS